MKTQKALLVIAYLLTSLRLAIGGTCPFSYVSVGSGCYKILNMTTIDWDGAWSLCLSNYGDLIKNIDERKMCELEGWLSSQMTPAVVDIWTNTELTEKHVGYHRELHHDPSTDSWLARRAESKKRNYPLCELGIDSSGCFTGWKSFGAFCYRSLFSKPLNFDEAEKECVKSNGHLVIAQSQEEWEFVKSLGTKDPTYIGLKSSNGKLQWVDGSTAEAFSTSVDSASAGGGSERCYAISAGASGSNGSVAGVVAKAQSCSQALNYACKVGKADSNTTSGCKTDSAKETISAESLPWKYSEPCPEKWSFLKNPDNACACIKLESNAIHFDDADPTCKSKFPDSRLASVRSRSENEILSQQMRQQNLSSVWIGYSRSTSDGSFAWTDGFSGVFANNKLPPEDANEHFINENCVFVQPNGSWTLDWCFNRRSFICRIETSCEGSTTFSSTVPTTTTTSTSTTTTTTTTTTATTTTATSPSTTPASTFPTVNPVEKAVAVVFQTVSSTYVVCILGATVAAFIVRRNFSVERVIMMSEEVSLLMAHILLLTAQDNYGNDLACIVVAILLHYFFFVHFTALFMHGVQVYAVITSVVAFGGFFNRKQYLAICWGIRRKRVPAIVVILTGISKGRHYINHRMCFLDLKGEAAVDVIFPVASVIVAALIAAEAAGVGEDFYPRLIDYDHAQMTTCLISQRGLMFIVPLSAAGWICSMVSVSEMNVGMYSVCVAVNITLACLIFFFHALTNAEIRFMFHMLYRKLKHFVCRHKRHKIEDGSFETNFGKRDIGRMN